MEPTFFSTNEYRRHGMVEVILTDRGSNFEAYLFQHLCSLLDAHKVRTTAFCHSQANGGAEERVIRNINWDLFLHHGDLVLQPSFAAGSWQSVGPALVANVRVSARRRGLLTNLIQEATVVAGTVENGAGSSPAGELVDTCF